MYSTVQYCTRLTKTPWIKEEIKKKVHAVRIFWLVLCRLFVCPLSTSNFPHPPFSPSGSTYGTANVLEPTTVKPVYCNTYCTKKREEEGKINQSASSARKGTRGGLPVPAWLEHPAPPKQGRSSNRGPLSLHSFTATATLTTSPMSWSGTDRLFADVDQLWETPCTMLFPRCAVIFQALPMMTFRTHRSLLDRAIRSAAMLSSHAILFSGALFATQPWFPVNAGYRSMA